MKFEARAFSLIPEQAPIELELVLGAKAGPQRHFAMTRSGETYKVDAVLPGEKLDQTVRIDARYPDGHIRGRVNDLTFQIGSRDVRLSDVRRCVLARVRRRSLATRHYSQESSRASARRLSPWAATPSSSTWHAQPRSLSRLPRRLSRFLAR